MTTEQPDALRLADILQHKLPSIECLEVAAAELRRLYAENEELRSRPESTPSSGESHEDSLKIRDEDLMRRALHALKYRGMSPWKVIQPVVKDLEERLK